MERARAGMQQWTAELRSYAEQVGQGKYCEEARSLGGIVAASGTYVKEREARIKAVKRSFHEVGGFWEAKVAWAYKRCVFISKVQNAALAAIEAFVPGKEDYLRLDKAVAAMGRRAMAGAAHKEEEGRHESLGTYEVL
eukprot:9938863-Lingulodinium_polyedra.AAC.1